MRTNWLVRQSILVCFKGLLEQRKGGSRGQLAIEFGASLVSKAAEYGEKYDQNLVYLSAICVLVGEQNESAIKSGEGMMSAERHQSYKEAAGKLIALLQDKGTEVLIQNVDLIRRFIGQGDESNNLSAAGASDSEMAA